MVMRRCHIAEHSAALQNQVTSRRASRFCYANVDDSQKDHSGRRAQRILGHIKLHIPAVAPWPRSSPCYDGVSLLLRAPPATRPSPDGAHASTAATAHSSPSNATARRAAGTIMAARRRAALGAGAGAVVTVGAAAVDAPGEDVAGDGTASSLTGVCGAAAGAGAGLALRIAGPLTITGAGDAAVLWAGEGAAAAVAGLATGTAAGPAGDAANGSRRAQTACASVMGSTGGPWQAAPS